MLADNLTKIATPSATEFVNVLRQNIIHLGTEGKENWIRPRSTQRAHSFGSFEYQMFDILHEIYSVDSAK